MIISKNKFLIILTALVLGGQTFYLHFNKPLQNIEIDLLIQTNKEKYEEKLNNKQKVIKEGKLFEILQTDLKIPKNANIEPVFIWNEKDKIKHNLKDKKSFDSVYLANLILYHNQIRDIYDYTKNTMIIESFRKMLTTIDTVNKQTPSIFTKKDISSVSDILINFNRFKDNLDSSISEINEFDNKILDLFKNMKNNENKKLSIENLAERAINEISLIIEMLTKSDNMYINVSNNKTGDPFTKFQGFLTIYNQTYELYASLITKYNKEVEKKENKNNWWITFFSLMLIIIAFTKDFRESE